ncbi:unnamed protein product [Lathyrus sativus]|nr:unnamed protein product [Lathyrus sativus]
MSILINGSTTKDFNMGKGLRQGGILSSFLFILVMEGLTQVVHNAVNMGLFKGFKINDRTSYNIVQFADDTLLIGEGD